MKLLIPYVDISQTMFYLFKQVKESISFAETWLPNSIETPRDLFECLKMNITYKNDRADREQLQTMKTLLGSDNVHGKPGAGDCDCFTITASACALVLGFDTKIILVGRDKREPVHIYNIINGKPFDLTCTYIGESRFYPYKQIIPLK